MAAITEWLIERIGLLRHWPPEMSRQEERLWGEAETLDDVGELTAQWLEGTIRSQPGYFGPVDVDEDYCPGLTATLVALNRAGFVTENSQASIGCPGYYRAPGEECQAWVMGFIDAADTGLLASLVSTVEGAGFGVQVWEGAARRRRFGLVPEGLGSQPSRGDIEAWFGACSVDLVAVACRAWQVRVYDPTAGRNDLWPVLHAWAGGS
jgi:Domain of unknown function (DUF6919)